MPITMTRDNYDRKNVPSGFNKVAIETMELGIEAGWKLLVTNRGHCTLIAPPPNEHVTFNVAKTRAAKGPVRIVRDRIRRLGDEEYQKVTEAAEATPADDEVDFHAPLLGDPAAERANARRRKQALDAAAVRAQVRTEPDTDDPERTVVSEEPMIAYEGSKGYISETTNIRTWSDGSIDYTCRAPKCEYDSERRHGIRAHWQKHIKSGEVEAVTSNQRIRFEVPEREPAWKRQTGPRKARIEALAEFIRGLDMPKIEPEELAHLMLSWVAEQSNSGGPLAGEREPLTDGQIVERVRALIDNGEYLAQRNEIARLRAESAEAEARVAKAENEAQKAKDTLRTFRELASEYDEESAS